MSLTVPVGEIVVDSSDPLLSIHESWERVNLNNVAEILNGFAFKSKHFNASSGVPLLRIRGVGTDDTDCFYDGPYDEQYLVKNGDLVIGMDGDFKCAIWKGPDALLNQRVCKVTSATVYERSFLSYVLPGYLKAINEHTSSQTVKHLSSQSIEEIPLPLPPLAEQKRIVAKVEELLAQVNAARDRLDKVTKIIKCFRQSVLAAACSGRLTEDWREKDLIDISLDDQSGYEKILPLSWHRILLEKLCSNLRYGSSKKSEKIGKIPVLRMGNIQDGEIDWTDLAYSADDAEIAKYSLKPNTVLFNRTNSPELVGKAAIYRGEQPAIYAGYLIGLEHGPYLLPQYLNYCLNSPEFKQYCSQVKTDGVNQSNINARKLAAYDLPWCPFAEQHEIVRQVEIFFKLADEIEGRMATATSRADKLTQSILAKAFRGELVPTEAELARQGGRDYEPASVLLERIKEKRGTKEHRTKERRTVRGKGRDRQ
ncbi:restriction endonuclease subunit S [Chloroflexota bacterium]